MSLELQSSKHHHHHLHFPRRHHRVSYDDSQLSMLMDPAYARPRSPLSETKFLKDESGELHDPDYRHFPPTSPSSSTTPAGRSKRTSSRASSVGRPSWELGFGGEMDEAEYQAYYNDGEEEEVQHKTYLSVPHRSHYPRCSSPSYTSYSTSSPTSSITSSPASYTTSLSDTDLGDYPSSPASCPTSTFSTRQQKFTKRLFSITTTRSSVFEDDHVHPSEMEHEWDDAEETMSLPGERDTEESASPKDGASAAESMKRQWQTTKFSVRFGVHRARRRVQKALGSGKTF